MKELWKFLRDEHKRALLSWLGAGIAALVAGAWSTFVYIFPHDKTSNIIATGNIDRSPITLGIPPNQLPAIIEASTSAWKQLSDEHQATIHTLEGNLGVGKQVLRSFFRALGEADVPPEKQWAKLQEIADRYKKLLIVATSADNPEIARLKADAQRALDAGEFPRARDLIIRARALKQPIVEGQELEIAALTAQLGQKALPRKTAR